MNWASKYKLLINSSPPSVAYMRQWINRVSIGTENGLSPIRRQAII